jgi:hypothetical protein
MLVLPQLLTLKLPHGDAPDLMTQTEWHKRLTTEHPLPALPVHTAPAIKEAVLRALSIEPSRRPSPAEIHSVLDQEIRAGANSSTSSSGASSSGAGAATSTIRPSKAIFSARFNDSTVTTVATSSSGSNDHNSSRLLVAHSADFNNSITSITSTGSSASRIYDQEGMDGGNDML